MNLEKFVNKKGLIPCKIIKGFDIYRPGSVAGFELKHVRGEGGLLAMGNVEVVGLDNKPAEPSEPADVPKITVGTPGGDLDIPVDWAKEHHMARINWAKKIEPQTEGITADKADEIIAKAVAAEE